MDIIGSCKAAVKGRGLRVVLPEGEDERILRAAAEIARENIARPIVLADDSHAVREKLASLGGDERGVLVLSPESDPAGPELAAHVAAGRLDPLHVACEGRLVAIVPGERAESALLALRAHPLGRDAALAGTVVAEHPGVVTLRSEIGRERLVPLLAGEQLPRIC